MYTGVIIHKKWWMRSNVVFIWLWQNNIKNLANDVYVCKSCIEWNTVNVQNRIQLFSQMYSHVQLNHHIPTDAQTREQKGKKQTNKKISLIILEDTKVNMRCVSYVSVSEQMLEWWMIHNSWAFKQHVAVSTLHSEVRMWCVVWNHIGQSHCVTWSHI